MRRKFPVLVMFLMVAGLSFGNQKVVITGNVQIGRDFDVMLTVTGDDMKNKVIASAKTVDGKFQFEMEPFEKPTKARLSFLGSVHGIIIEEENISYEYSPKKGSSVKGGFYNNLIYSWESSQRSQEIFANIYDITSTPRPANEAPEALAAARNTYNTLSRELQNIVGNHLRSLLKHSDPYVKLFAFLELPGRTDDEMNLLVDLQKEFPDNNEIKFFIQQMESSRKIAEAAKKVAIGNKLVDFTANTIDGKSVNFSSQVYKNKYTLLEIWASWCAPCRKSIKTLPPVYTKFHDAGFEIFAISVDEEKSKWENASKEIKMPWIDVYNIFGGQNDVGELYGITTIPKNILFDKSGTIVALDVNAEFLDKFLTEKISQ